MYILYRHAIIILEDMPMKNMPSKGLLTHHILYLFRHSQAVKRYVL